MPFSPLLLEYKIVYMSGYKMSRENYAKFVFWGQFVKKPPHLHKFFDDSGQERLVF